MHRQSAHAYVGAHFSFEQKSLCHCQEASALAGKIELDNILAPQPRTFAPAGCFHTTRWCAGAPSSSLPSLNLLEVVCCVSQNVKLSSSGGCGFLIRHCRLRKRKIRSSPSFSVHFFLSRSNGGGVRHLADVRCVNNSRFRISYATSRLF